MIQKLDHDNELSEQIAYFKTYRAIQPMLDSAQDIFLILNETSQIVFANQQLYNAFDLKGESILGRKVGGALRCMGGKTDECDIANPFCQSCGVLHAIQAVRDGRQIEQETHFTTIQGNLQNFRISAHPLVVGNWHFSMITMQDITHETRRHTLEHIFFHDLLNLAGPMVTLAALLKEVETNEDRELKTIIYDLSLRLVDEVNAQRDLANAEHGDLYIRVQPTYTLDILNELKSFYQNQSLGTGRYVVIAPDAYAEIINTDPVLLRRVLGNMVKNALEASMKNQTVTLSCTKVGEEIQFTVHNPTVIPDHVQPHIFQRSFSTKGKGRGLGTYSMKLLTERYLQGQVGFCSDPQNGTRFVARLPLELS
ncbi:MAG: HAMP domain-containing histidine kinase [Anaerolineaceae bacterium]|nr:HAMP domain-containing histidine kinase [Anaerolineaceae bacterium]